MSDKLVVLVNPGHDDEVDLKIARSFGAQLRKVQREDPPISIINLGGFIRDHGFNVVIVDTHVEPDYKSRLKELVAERPLIVGFSVILGKFTKNAITLTKMVKEMNADIPVVWGGKLVHLAKNLILKSIDVDFLIIGDGEFSFLSLLNCLNNGTDYRKIPGIGYKENGIAVINMNCGEVNNLDSLYISSDFGWNLIRHHINMRQIPYFINLYTSRGCKFNCSFCYLKDIKQLSVKSRFRRRSAANVIREIEYLNKTFGINVVTFGDDDLLSNINEIRPVIDYLKKNNIFIEHLWTNIYNLTTAAIDLLKGVCQTICYSIETTSPRLQKILNKVIHIEKVIDVNKRLREAGMNTVHNFLFGVPTETDEDTKATIDLLRKLKEVNPYMRANTYILSPIPKTPIFEFAQKITGTDIIWDMDDLANFHFRYMGRAAFKFRPYFTPDDNLFYETVSEITNVLFAELNAEPIEEILEKININPRLSYIFGDVYNIAKPIDSTRKYILDRVIEAMDRNLPLPKIEAF